MSRLLHTASAMSLDSLGLGISIISKSMSMLNLLTADNDYYGQSLSDEFDILFLSSCSRPQLTSHMAKVPSFVRDSTRIPRKSSHRIQAIPPAYLSLRYGQSVEGWPNRVTTSIRYQISSAAYSDAHASWGSSLLITSHLAASTSDISSQDSDDP